VTYGIFLCLVCSGSHRRMGTHISFVRSANLDSLNIGNLLQMEVGGNARAAEFFRSRGVKGKVDYNSALAMQYKEALKSAVQRVLDTKQPCLAIDPNSVIIEEPEQQASSTDFSFNSAEEIYANPNAVVVEPLRQVEKPAVPEIVPIVTTSSTPGAPLKAVPAGKLSAKLIDDFDFDSVPETVPATQIVAPVPSFTSPVMRPSEISQPSNHATPRVDFAVTRGSSYSVSSSQFWGEDPPSVRSSPGLSELKEKGKELVSRGFQAGKDLYQSFMHR
jgi:hypothetical protein